MSLMMTLSNFGVLGFAVHQRIFSLRILQILRLPLLMSGMMSIVYFSLQQLNLNFLVTLSLAVCAYAILVAIVMVRELGGLDRVRQSIVKFRS